MSGTMLLSLLVAGAIFLGIVAILMWAADRWLGKWVATLTGGAAVAYIGYSIVSGMIYCAAEPVYIPPTDAEAAAGIEGAMHFNCDSAGGVFDRLYLYFVAPMVMIALVFMTWRAWQKRASE
jgi:hypothetical protein